MQHIIVRRASVCMGDDINAPHQSSIDVEDDELLSSLFSKISIYLPKVAGKCTWMICSDKVLGFLAGYGPGQYNIILKDDDCLISKLGITDIFCHYYAGYEWKEYVKEIMSQNKI